MNIINDLEIKGKRVLIRVDFNVPIIDGLIVDDFRIKASLPTINHCLNMGASVVLMSHLGRPNGKIMPEMSLDPIAFCLEDLTGKEVMFSDDCASEESIELSQQMQPGEIHLLENLRYHEGEPKNDDNFSWFLSRHADIYVNDAFGTAHRKHASNVGITKHVKTMAAGFLIEKELKYLCKAINSPKSPVILILGGAKISDKIDLITNMIDKINMILIGGAMAFTFLKAKGVNVGSSLVDEKNIEIANKIIKLAKKKKVDILLPDDCVCSEKLDENEPWRVSSIDLLRENETGYDIGPETAMNFELLLSDAQTIIWNGPLGVCEIPSFSTGTQFIASVIKNRTDEGAVTIIGGGDTAIAIKKAGIDVSFSHISTGGGASLELLSGKKLPALEALRAYE